MKITRISNNFRNIPLSTISENAWIDNNNWARYPTEDFKYLPKFYYLSEMRALKHYYLRIRQW
jgi:hypothetical protein